MELVYGILHQFEGIWHTACFFLVHAALGTLADQSDFDAATLVAHASARARPAATSTGTSVAETTSTTSLTRLETPAGLIGE